MNQSQALERLDQYIRARYPVVSIVSHEENRVMSGIKAVGAKRGYDVFTWTYTHGIQDMTGVEGNMTRDLAAAFDTMLAYPVDAKPALFVMLDVHNLLGDKEHGWQPMEIRFLRDLVSRFEGCKHSLILLSPAFSTPPDLEKSIAIIDWPLPDTEELAAILSRCQAELPAKVPVTLNGNRDKVVNALRGLTAFEAASVLSSGVVATRELGDSIVPVIVREKAQIIKKSGVLEYFDNTVTMQDVGGLQYLKSYADKKRKTLTSSKARAKGLDTPKGVILVGVPGTGKSLSAKAIAGGQMPILRMDVGALMGGIVGQSEANTRSALKVTEAVAPCVLWIDEIEKALGGGGGELDGGTSARVFGTILTWMQETTAPVYCVATANDVSQLKPELISRFDDVFFVDLPSQDAREEILKVHLVKRGQNLAMLDVVKVAENLWGFSGREIEKVVRSAIESAFYSDRDITTDDLMEAAGTIVPVTFTMKEKIESIRAWATTSQARQAGEQLDSKPVPQKEALAGSRELDLD
jgi:AAA+ superfamily predicted ATPase